MKKVILLCWTLFLLFSLCGLAAEFAGIQVQKASGEPIQFSLSYVWKAEEKGAFYLYRRTGLTSTPSKVVTLAQTQLTYDYMMPGGTTKEYRFYAVPVFLSQTGSVIFIGPASNEVLVKRK